MNSATIIGNLGRDAERLGENAAKLSVATTSRYKGKSGEWKDRTEWHSVVLNKCSDKMLALLVKGAKVALQGEIQYRERDGKYYTNIVTWNVELLSFEKRQAEPEQDTPTRDTHTDDDLPF